jgi:hypothetical protein
MSSASDGVRPDVCEFCVRGRPVGRRNRLFVIIGRFAGVDGRTVASRGAANKGEEISGREGCYDGGMCEGDDPTNPVLVLITSHFTGPSRPSEIILVLLLFPLRRPSNSASREFKPLGT